MRTQRVIGIGLALIVVSLFAIAGTGGAQADAGPSRIKDKAAKFAKSGEVELVEVEDGAFSGVKGLGQYKDKSSGDDYVWDEATGFITYYSRTETYEKRGKGAAIPAARARQIATQWAERCYDGVDFKKMQVTEELKAEGDNEATKEWKVEFRRFIGEVPTYDHFIVLMDAVTGEVMSVSQDCVTLNEGVEPTIPEEDAIAIAAQALGLDVTACTGAHLEIGRLPGLGQRLAWLVEFDTGNTELIEKGFVAVDAHDGGVLDSGQTW